MGSSSKIIDLYSLNSGRIKIVIKGGRKPGTRYAGITEVLNRIKVRFTEKEYGGFHYFISGSLIKRYKLKKDNLMEAFKIIQLILPLPNGVENRELYHLFTNTLDILEREHIPSLYYNFIYKLISSAGYKPELYSCVKCGRPVRFFSIKEGGLCEKHGKGERLNREEWEAFRNLAVASLNENITLSDRLKDLLENYYRYHLLTGSSISHPF